MSSGFGSETRLPAFSGMRSSIQYPHTAGTIWLLVTGYWLLVTGYWLLVTGYWPSADPEGGKGNVRRVGRDPSDSEFG